MTQEKRLRFTCIDLFVVILLLVLAVAFIGKGYLVSLIQHEKETSKVVYTLSLPGEADVSDLTVGSALFTPAGHTLGVITDLQPGEGEQTSGWLCFGEMSAQVREDGIALSADTLLKPGQSLVFLCGEREFTAVIVEMKAA